MSEAPSYEFSFRVGPTGLMGRRSEHSPEELRELILTATRRVIVEAGFQQLSAREIARAIGYAPGTLYNMFKNLDDILLRVEIRVLEELDGRIAEAIKGKRGADAARAFAQAYVEFAYRHPRLWELIQEHHPVDRSSAQDWYLEQLYAPVARLEAVLGRIPGKGDADETARLARLVWSSVHGVLHVATTAKFGPLPLTTTLSMAETLAGQLATSSAATQSDLRHAGPRIDDDDKRRRHAG